MRGGRHLVEFTFTDDEQGIVNLGVIRPVSLTNDIDVEAEWRGQVYPFLITSRIKPAVAEKLRSQRTARWGHSNVHCCSYHCSAGSCNWTDWDNERSYERSSSSNWPGREGFWAESGTIGLLIDLNEDTLSVFKNGRRLGVMKDGLGGEYVWFVGAARSACTISMSKGRAPN